MKKTGNTNTCNHVLDYFCLFDLMLYVHGHVCTVIYLTTLFLGKPPAGSLPILSAHSFASY